MLFIRARRIWILLVFLISFLLIAKYASLSTSTKRIRPKHRVSTRTVSNSSASSYSSDNTSHNNNGNNGNGNPSTATRIMPKQKSLTDETESWTLLPFFSDKKVDDFRRRFIAEQATKRLNTSSSVSFLLRGHNAGFTSYLNNGLNLMLWALSSGVSFHFHVQKEDWAHLGWLQFFHDFSDQTSNPIILELELNDTISSDMANRKLWIGRENDATFPFLIQPRNQFYGMQMIPQLSHVTHYFFRPFGENWNALMNVGMLEEFIGPNSEKNTNAVLSDEDLASVFSAKSILAKALWDPNSELKAVIKLLLVHSLANSNPDVKNAKLYPGQSIQSLIQGKSIRPFISVHIRKGDKIRLEATDIPLEKYAEIVGRWFAMNFELGIKDIFVFSDNADSISAFKSLMHELDPSLHIFSIYDMVDQVALANADFNKNDYTSSMKGYEHWDYPKLDREIRLKHTREMIISLSIASLSTACFCTMTSNVCRFVTLLLDDASQSHSIDRVQWMAS